MSARMALWAAGAGPVAHARRWLRLARCAATGHAWRPVGGKRVRGYCCGRCRCWADPVRHGRSLRRSA